MEPAKSDLYIKWALRVITATIISIGTFWLIAWFSGLAPEWSFEDDLIVSGNMALCLFLSGIIFLLLIIPAAGYLIKIVGTPLSIFIFTIGLLTLTENLFNYDLGIDDMLAVTSTSYVNRSGFAGSISLALLGAGLLFLIWEKQRMASYIGIALLIFDLVPLTGYFLNIHQFYSNVRITRIAFETVIAMIAAGLGLVLIPRSITLVRILTGDTAGGILLRKLLPSIILLPLTLGFLIIEGEHLELYSQVFGTGILLVSLIVVFSILAYFIARTLNDLDLLRKLTAADLTRTKENLAVSYADAEHRRIELKTILDNVPIAIWIAHDAGCHNITGNKYANERIMKVSGEVNISASAPPEDAAVRYRVFRNGKELKPEELPAQVAVATGKPYDYETVEMVFDDGRKIYLLEGAVPQFDEEGNVTGAIVTGVDVTLQYKAEADLKKSQEALLAAQNTLKLALDNGNIGIWQVDLKTNNITWDERMEKIFGLRAGTFGKTIEAFHSLVREEDIPRLHKAASELIDKDTPYNSLYQTVPINGKSKYITSKAFLEKDPLGKPVGLLGVSMDVTHLMEGAEKQILNLNEELLRSNKELENFAYIASHDLQEPLRMVTSFLQLLQMRYNKHLDEDANTYIHFAVDGAKRMYDLLNGLLAYSRIKMKGHEFGLVDMNEVITKVKANLSLKITETQAVIDHDDLPRITADENQIVQLLQNLIDNAIKFSRNKPRITISSSLADGYYVFSVKDQGIGIDPQYFERIFKIFQRLHLQGEFNGMGVGLAICQRIVERHKGRIWVESQTGKGSTFVFSIPRNIELYFN